MSTAFVPASPGAHGPGAPGAAAPQLAQLPPAHQPIRRAELPRHDGPLRAL